MKRYFFFIFFFIFINNHAWSNQNKSTSQIEGCSYKINENYLNQLDNLPIKLIEVDVHDYRKWTVNGVRILTNRYRYVPDKFKRRYDATITITYDDESKCFLKGRVRHSGDEKDHIGQLNNSITQSLDIHLQNGNIRGITKFKLLRPNTRGNLEDEIFITEILRNLNYLAPRSIKVQSRVNRITSTMLFQEKAAKEMLEYNNRREGPILEADERFFFKTVSKIEDNNLSGWDMGVVPLMNKSSKYMLSKQVNANILEKSDGHKQMSFNAVTNLNLIYLYFSNRFQDEINNYNYFDYDLDNTLLGSFEKSKIAKLDEYNLFIQAINGTHGLAANNRKFYWNSIENYFEPVNYDSNANINKGIKDVAYRYPISEDFYNAFGSLNLKLNNLNIPMVTKNLNLSGLNFTQKSVEQKIIKIIDNLKNLEKNYLSNTSTDLITHNKTKSLENFLDNFHKNLKDQHPNTFLIKYNLDINKLQKCEIFLEQCYEIDLSKEELSNLLEGELKDNNNFLQFLGNNFDFKNLSEYNNYNYLNYEDVNIFFEDGVDLNFDKLNNIIKIKQKISGAKVFFIEGGLKDLRIEYSGFENKEIDSNKKLPKDFPINETGLTGCLSFINIEMKNIDIQASNSTCEDTVNFINTTGNVNNITINNSLSDALDVDFSKLDIKNINVKSAKNDCVDFSYGNYTIDKLNLSDCGDKALSVGEKSKLYLNKINANSALIGVASKDSSMVELENVNFNLVGTCLSAYKKKQEFNGGIIKVNKMNCNYLSEKTQFDKYSLIKGLNKL